jgi:hypothetical protein
VVAVVVASPRENLHSPPPILRNDGNDVTGHLQSGVAFPLNSDSGEAQIKTILFLAALIVLASYTWLWFWLGKKSGKALEAAARKGVDPKWVEQVEHYIADLVHPPASAADLDDMVVMPEEKREIGKKLLFSAPGASARRTERRAGY